MRAACLLLVAAGCAAPPPPLDECTRGTTWADCPGDEGPVLACGGPYEESCYWFTGAVASGYAPCDGSLVGCCPRGSSSPSWERDRDRQVEVVLAPVSTDVRPAITCSDMPANLGVLCAAPMPHLVASAARSGGTVTGAIWSYDELYGHRVTVDVVRDHEGTIRARVCRVPWTDVGPTYCPATTTEACATGGTITLAAFPATDGPVSLDAHVVLGGTTLDLRL